MLIERRVGGGEWALILLNDGSRVVKGEKVKREEEEKTGDSERKGARGEIHSSSSSSLAAWSLLKPAQCYRGGARAPGQNN